LASILKRIVSCFGAKSQDAKSERVFVGVFGKHPGWDDHIDDIGFETDTFVTVKRLLYIQGIGGNIDSGSWDKLQPDQVIKEFKHVFIWCMDKNVVVGRIWSSRDGKGRTSYPMIVCVQCHQLPLDWVLKNILPRLERVEETCIATASAADVHKIIENARNEFRQVGRQYQSSADSAVVSRDALGKLADLPEAGLDDIGLLRILYHVERELARYGGDSTKTREFRPTFLRIPVSSSCLQESALLWINFLLAKLGRGTPALMLIPSGQHWADIIIGDPTEVQLYCLRASLAVIPFTSSVPYNMSPEFTEQAKQLIEDARRHVRRQNAEDTA
jgi:hypothetical protein